MELDGTLVGGQERRRRREVAATGRPIVGGLRRPTLATILAAVGVALLVVLVGWAQQIPADQWSGAVDVEGVIGSPAGAYAPAPALGGPATYTLDVTTVDGAEVSQGSVTFTLPAADFRFVSTAIEKVASRNDVLVVQGSGTVADRGDYRFSLVGRVQDPEGFRFTVWEKTSSANRVVYDNG